MREFSPLQHFPVAAVDLAVLTQRLLPRLHAEMRQRGAERLALRRVEIQDRVVQIQQDEKGPFG